MLEDLAADHELGGMASGIELLDRGHLEVDLDAGGPGPLACVLEHRRKRVAAAYAEPAAGQPDRQLALAAAHLVRPTSSSRSARNPATSRRAIGFDVPYLS